MQQMIALQPRQDIEDLQFLRRALAQANERARRAESIIETQKSVITAERNARLWYESLLNNPTFSESDIRILARMVPLDIKMGIVDSVEAKKIYLPATAEDVHMSDKTLSRHLRKLAQDTGVITYHTEKEDNAEGMPVDRVHVGFCPPSASPGDVKLPRVKAGGSTWEDGKRIKLCPSCHSPDLEKRNQTHCRGCGKTFDGDWKPVNDEIAPYSHYDAREESEKSPCGQDDCREEISESAEENLSCPPLTVCTGGVDAVACGHVEYRAGYQAQDVALPTLEELRRYTQWVCWRYGAIDLKTGRREKIPINPRTGANADHGDPATWASYDEAIAFRASGKVVDGIGFVFHNDYTGIDLDGCRDPETGKIEEWAWNIIRAFNSYTEISVSGKGVHIIVKGTVEAGIKRLLDGHKVEMYSVTRFFTWSGVQLLGTPSAIAARQSEIDALYQRIVPPVQVIDASPVCSIIAESDQALLNRALRDEKFRVLWTNDIATWGKWYLKDDGSPDYSSADMAFVRKLYFYCGNDPARMNGLFQQSELMRPKWHEKRGAKTYGQITIEKVTGPPPVHTKPSPETAQAQREAVTV